jgi:hypothetical protein
MNILEQEDIIKSLPDAALQQEMSVPSGQVPQFLVLSEIQRRTDMRDRFEATEDQPQGSVKDRIMAEGLASVMPQMNMAALPLNSPVPARPNSSSPSLPVGDAPQGLAGMGVQYASTGGVVRMQEGQQVPNYVPSVIDRYQQRRTSNLAADDFERRVQEIYRQLPFRGTRNDSDRRAEARRLAEEELSFSSDRDAGAELDAYISGSRELDYAQRNPEVRELPMYEQQFTTDFSNRARGNPSEFQQSLIDATGTYDDLLEAQRQADIPMMADMGGAPGGAGAIANGEDELPEFQQSLPDVSGRDDDIFAGLGSSDELTESGGGFELEGIIERLDRERRNIFGLPPKVGPPTPRQQAWQKARQTQAEVEQGLRESAGNTFDPLRLQYPQLGEAEENIRQQAIGPRDAAFATYRDIVEQENRAEDLAEMQQAFAEAGIAIPSQLQEEFDALAATRENQKEGMSHEDYLALNAILDSDTSDALVSEENIILEDRQFPSDADADAEASSGDFLSETEVNELLGMNISSSADAERKIVDNVDMPLTNSFLTDLNRIGEEGADLAQTRGEQIQELIDNSRSQSKKDAFFAAITQLGAGIASGDMSAGIEAAQAEVSNRQKAQNEKELLLETQRMASEDKSLDRAAANIAAMANIDVKYQQLAQEVLKEEGLMSRDQTRRQVAVADIVSKIFDSAMYDTQAEASAAYASFYNTMARQFDIPVMRADSEEEASPAASPDINQLVSERYEL